MKLFQEILVKIFEKEEINISFSNLEINTEEMGSESTGRHDFG